MDAEQYNYADFDIDREQPPFLAFRQHLPAGERATSYPLEDLATGETVELKKLWASGPAVLEFGSFT